MPYALVTGASRGIGRAFALELARRKYDLLLVGRNQVQLGEVAAEVRASSGVEVHYLVQDLALPGAADAVKSWYDQNFENLQVVINNAGYGLNGNFEALSLDDQSQMIQVNVLALVQLSHAFLPVLRQQPKGYLLNVSSTTAYQTIPYMSVYAASKAFVASFTRGLHHELRHSNVVVTCLSPGGTDTDFVNRAGAGPRVRKAAEKFNMTPGEVAIIGLDALFGGKKEVVAGWINKIGAFLPRLLPDQWTASAAGRLYEP